MAETNPVELPTSNGDYNGHQPDFFTEEPPALVDPIAVRTDFDDDEPISFVQFLNYIFNESGEDNAEARKLLGDVEGQKRLLDIMMFSLMTDEYKAYTLKFESREDKIVASVDWTLHLKKDWLGFVMKVTLAMIIGNPDMVLSDSKYGNVASMAEAEAEAKAEGRVRVEAGHPCPDVPHYHA